MHTTPECAYAKGQWVYTSGPTRARLQVGGPVMEHLVSPGDTVLLTSQNTPEALFWVALQPPAPAASQGSEGGGAGGEGLPNFPNTVAPGLGDHPLASSLKFLWNT